MLACCCCCCFGLPLLAACSFLRSSGTLARGRSNSRSGSDNHNLSQLERYLAPPCESVRRTPNYRRGVDRDGIPSAACMPLRPCIPVA